MTPRSIRRAMERKAKKAALKAVKHLNPEPAEALDQSASHALPAEHSTRRREVLTESLCWHDRPQIDTPAEPSLFASSAVSAAQLAANRANAKLSSGPTSAAGQAKSSLNAVKTGLTGSTVLLPSDDAPAYERHLRAYQEDFCPVGARECDLVQSIADTAWRLKRIPCLEAAIFAQGHIEFAEAFDNHDPALRASMIELQTYLKYEKQIRNLQLQESRLARRREKEMIELRQLQQERREAEKEALEAVANRSLAVQARSQPFEPAANGFVFSNPQIEEYLECVQSRNPASQALRTAEQAA